MRGQNFKCLASSILFPGDPVYHIDYRMYVSIRSELLDSGYEASKKIQSEEQGNTFYFYL